MYFTSIEWKTTGWNKLCFSFVDYFPPSSLKNKESTNPSVCLRHIRIFVGSIIGQYLIHNATYTNMYLFRIFPLKINIPGRHFEEAPPHLCSQYFPIHSAP